MTELKNTRVKKRSAIRKSNLQPTSSPECILEAFEKIVDLAKDSNLDDNFIKNAQLYIQYASDKLGLTEQQTILLSLFLDKSNSRILISEIAEYVGCSTTRMLRLSKDIDHLVELNYLKVSKTKKSISYRMPWEVIDSLRNDAPYLHHEEAPVDTLSFFSQFAKMMDEKDDEEISYQKIVKRTDEMLFEIKSSILAQELRKCNLNSEDKILFIFMAHLFVENSDDNIGFNDIEKLYDYRYLPSWSKKRLQTGNSRLFETKLIEHVNDDGMVKPDRFKLTNYAKETLLKEVGYSDFGKSQKGLLQSDILAKKELIFNPEERDSVKDLMSILSKDRFADIQRRLEKAGMRKGFCCLFYGAPGTGKTETVYQIARETGRNIMKVDVDKIKSCWVGESEKNIKALFDRYRNICKNSEISPILLFNEADAVLGVRMEGAARAIDKMENSIQNIILQEMENLEGIMIATTNLTSNLDKAFERRFLYKIRYEKPSLEGRMKIWKLMLPDITTEDATILANRFDLSGGEIENIARKHMVNAILSGDERINIEKISETCLKERINSRTSRVGF